MKSSATKKHMPKRKGYNWSSNLQTLGISTSRVNKIHSFHLFSTILWFSDIMLAFFSEKEKTFFVAILGLWGESTTQSLQNHRRLLWMSKLWKVVESCMTSEQKTRSLEPKKLYSPLFLATIWKIRNTCKGFFIFKMFFNFPEKSNSPLDENTGEKKTPATPCVWITVVPERNFMSKLGPPV